LLERKSGRIVYIGNDGNIYVTDQGGVNRTAITADALVTEQFYHVYRAPTWSPDSEQLAFIGESGSIEEGTFNPSDIVLYTVPREGGLLTEAYNSDDSTAYYLYWSPDGRYVSFLSADVNDLTAYDLQAVSPDGSGSPFVLDSARGAPIYHSWAPNGESVLVHSNATLPGGVLSALELTTAEARPEQLPYAPAVFQAPAWSPDGSLMLFATTGGGDQDQLVVTNAQGQEARVITEYAGRVAFGWSPDGRYVAYITSEDSPASGGSGGISGSLHLYDLQHNETTTLREDEDVVAFFWSPNSNRLAYFTQSLVELEEIGDRAIVLGLNIAPARGGESRELLGFLPPPGFFEMLRFFDQYQRSTTIWSPDSQNLVFATFDEQGRSVVVVMHASGSLEPRGIAEGTLAFWSWE
jgi:TolB protein